MKFLHQLPDVKDLFEIIADERGILPSIVEKDYWVMHCLWGIQKNGFKFELKGGTSLSKGFGVIERFSEDLDLQIHPEDSYVKTGKNQDKEKHIMSRKKFFDEVASELDVIEMEFKRDPVFDDPSGKMRGAGIKATYQSFFELIPSLKEGVILELGFDTTTPNEPRVVTSWAYERAQAINLEIVDNRAKNVLCYFPEYTFVEKLQTISTKYRNQQANGDMPVNFLRHYYDVYKLLELERILNFIGSDEYEAHKKERFRGGDELIIKNNPAFTIDVPEVRERYSKEFEKKSAIYFGKQPTFEEILQRIHSVIDRL